MTYAWRERPRQVLAPVPIVEPPTPRRKRVRIARQPSMTVAEAVTEVYAGEWRTRERGTAKVDMRELDVLTHARPDLLETGTLGAIVRAGAVESA